MELNKNLEDVTNSLNDNGINFNFGIDTKGNYGYYKAGADSVIPFKNCPDYECSIRGYNSSGYHGIIINNLCVKNYNRIRIVSQNSSWGQYPNKGKNMGNNTWDITDADYISFDLQTSGSASSSVYQTYRLYNE